MSREDLVPAIRPIDVFDSYQCTMLLTLQRASYQIEADLIAYPDLPPLKDTADSLQGSGETFWVITSLMISLERSATRRAASPMHYCASPRIRRSRQASRASSSPQAQRICRTHALSPLWLQ